MPYPSHTLGVAALLIIPFDCSFPSPSLATASTGADSAQLFFGLQRRYKQKFVGQAHGELLRVSEREPAAKRAHNGFHSSVQPTFRLDSRRETEKIRERAAQSMRPMRDLELEFASFFFFAFLLRFLFLSLSLSLFLCLCYVIRSRVRTGESEQPRERESTLQGLSKWHGK